MGWYEYDSETGYDYYEPSWFYAVAVGRRTGIFTSHEEAVEQVHGFPSFRMRKFNDYEEARDYLEEFDIFCESLTEDGSQEREVEEEDPEGENGTDSWFYAVAVGRTTGIFLDFEDARDQIYGYPRSRMEKFLDYDEAEKYIEKIQILYEEEEEKEEEERRRPSVWFYAVAVGRSTGVYMNYQEAVEQVHGFSGFRMKKFGDYEEAEAYIAFNQVYSSDEEENEGEEEEEPEEKDIWYYAVAVGRSTGVYTDWQVARAQVHGYSGFRMKKFLDYSEAQEYIGNNCVYYGEDEEEKNDEDDEEELEQEQVWYYAVAVGRRVGIYTSRDDALEQVYQYPNFRLKKFLDYSEAQEYIDTNREYCGNEGWEESDGESEDMEKEETWFYAVAVGRHTGIYTSHDDAIEQVHGYPGFRMKKFLDYDEAEEYIDFNQVYSSEEDWGSESEPEEEVESWYYAVGVGRSIGVYTDWQIALNQVHGYPGFRMKKFLDLSEAWQYVRQSKNY
ncbi:hypothetical protein PF005_g13635 [Phytophthora fragariae]|uniref:ribonuclease H n=1 Tax=Phytophthora fragariae TaxID=53985 RepID=A0A6A3XLS1_9STRA|nr:hypothetical protein PF003_g25335 [Phytophthora fragariae]KAE8935212.1 hypothetical protein PF009_g14830 [Phytophthora fragariae]KAE9004709.1 hypothetical protein PF011_g12337 [Phytophthora fragariae]KAE9104431.1 hypothetical protein PF010_g13384 [Phytophthora fragariae]KAE9105753.1 hypothetical protein PF007_g13645 [Phytophthora fragariae]